MGSLGVVLWRKRSRAVPSSASSLKLALWEVVKDFMLRWASCLRGLPPGSEELLPSHTISSQAPAFLLLSAAPRSQNSAQESDSIPQNPLFKISKFLSLHQCSQCLPPLSALVPAAHSSSWHKAPGIFLTKGQGSLFSPSSV